MGMLRVEARRSLEAIAPLRGSMDALNLASRRPCPFSTFEYIEAFVRHDEYARPRDELLLLAAFDEGGALVGYLPLMRRRERMLGLPYVRIGMLVSHDTDRPHVVARAEDEARCAAAFYAALLEDERRWSALELGMQDAESALQTVPPLRSWRFFARRFENMPNTTVPLPFGSLGEYLASLTKNERRAFTRRSRSLLAAGRVEHVYSADPRALADLLELYLDVERRSWKEAAGAGIRRDLRRVAFFKALTDASQPLQLAIDLISLDDLPIVGLVSGVFANGVFALETAYDHEYEDLGPGRLLSLLAIGRAIDERRRSINFEGNYAYYKARLGGVVTPTQAVQIFRVGTAPWLHARLGDLRRRLRPPRVVPLDHNPERRRASDDHEPAEVRARLPRDQEREHARAILSALAARGASVLRRSGDALWHALPFSLNSRKAA